MLGELGPEASAAVGDLAEALKDQDEGVRAAAATALGKVGPKAQDAFPDLLTALNDSALLVRDAAAHTLESFGPPPASRLPLLEEALREPRSQARLRMYALHNLAASNVDAKEVLPLFTAAVTYREAEVRLEAVRGMAKFGPAAREVVFPPLAAAMDDADSGVREAAYDVLSRFGAPVSAEVPALRNGLKAKAVKARRYCAQALAKLGPQSRAAAAELTEALGDSDEEVRKHAAQALVAIGPEEKAALPGIGEALKTRDEALRQAAARALMRADPDTALPFFVAALKDDDVGVRKTAVVCIGQLGPRALTAADRVRPLVDDPNLAVRLPAAETLWLIQRQPFVPVQALNAMLKDRDPKIRQGAAEALGRIGPPAAIAFVPLAGLLSDKEAGVRVASAAALKGIGGKEASTIPNLLAGLHDPAVAKDVGAVLVGFGSAAVPALIKELDDEDALVRGRVAGVLGAMGPTAADAMRVLTFRSKNDSDATVREAAAEALKKIKR
jgi:HEAT repeat protein